MKRSLARGAALLLLAVSTGCAMCQTPFDYCGPTTNAKGCPNCNFSARRGSAFIPTEEGVPVTTEVGPKPPGEPARTPAEPQQDLSPPPDQELPPPSMSTAAPEFDTDEIFSE